MPPKPSTAPPRLSFVQSPAADVAVVFRRGPSNWCAVLRWDTATGEVEEGAWLKGRILCADFCHAGRYLSTMLMKGGQVYNVISVAPWLHPLNSRTESSTWGTCGFFLAPGDERESYETRLGPSPTNPAVRLSARVIHRKGFGVPPAHLLPENLQFAALTPAGRVILATENGTLQLAEIRGKKSLKVLSEFETAPLTPNPQPPPQHVMSWGTWSPPSRSRKKSGK